MFSRPFVINRLLSKLGFCLSNNYFLSAFWLLPCSDFFLAALGHDVIPGLHSAAASGRQLGSTFPLLHAIIAGNCHVCVIPTVCPRFSFVIKLQHARSLELIWKGCSWKHWLPRVGLPAQCHSSTLIHFKWSKSEDDITRPDMHYVVPNPQNTYRRWTLFTVSFYMCYDFDFFFKFLFIPSWQWKRS